ncbi:hypothetical protein HYFRA_00011195 [Hymenoscyphus fraxineus]|uniref:Uncharacterized protein n=1 Tax=Hymenoscyphus fraxineus TaxID=746836 RepID=A0A9N9L1A5_9HELO|nr:hypothetical protein HYFRA_00011195 [Hymenoscyphus fraxineus]
MSSEQFRGILARKDIGGRSDWQFGDRLYAVAVAYMLGHSKAAEVKVLLDSLYDTQNMKCLKEEHDVRSIEYELRPQWQDKVGRLMTANEMREAFAGYQKHAILPYFKTMQENIAWKKEQDSFWLYGIFEDFLNDVEGEKMKVGGLPPVDPSTRKPVEPPFGLDFPDNIGFSEAREPPLKIDPANKKLRKRMDMISQMTVVLELKRSPCRKLKRSTLVGRIEPDAKRAKGPEA